MVCLGAVVFDDRLDQTFYGQTRPIADRFVPEALAVSGFTREQHLTFDDHKISDGKLRQLAGGEHPRPPGFRVRQRCVRLAVYQLLFPSFPRAKPVWLFWPPDWRSLRRSRERCDKGDRVEEIPGHCALPQSGGRREGQRRGVEEVQGAWPQNLITPDFLTSHICQS